jgi:hypothetical protein
MMGNAGIAAGAVSIMGNPDGTVGAVPNVGIVGIGKFAGGSGCAKLHAVETMTNPAVKIGRMSNIKATP